ncbi:MAG: M48 family metallopeptidase [Sulfitobacter sp.]
MNGLMPARAHYFDGDAPVGQPVQPQISGDTLELRLEDGTILHWPLSEIRQVSDSAAKTNPMLRWINDPLARLVLKDPKFLRDMPNLRRRSPPKGRGRLVAWALAAVAAVALQIGILIPLLADNLAVLIPAEGERVLGEATLGHIRDALDETGLNPLEVCETPNGSAALDRLVAKLSGKRDFRQDVTVSVLDHEMVNAFALPGGFVVIFRGLIDAADGPDEVAAVLAHEIGHVISRDPTRHALRSAGSIGVLGLLFGDFAGGAAVLLLTERLISAQYSQDAESGADEFAYGVLSQAGINPGALGDMFESMRDKHGDSDGVTAHFLSHPTLSERITAARAVIDPDADYAPSMSDEDWTALQSICG